VDTTEEGVAIVRQRLDRRLAKLTLEHEDSQSLRFKVNGHMWSATENVSFPELLDIVEAGLRQPAEGATSTV
jgi:hypothetical protein